MIPKQGGAYVSQNLYIGLDFLSRTHTHTHTHTRALTHTHNHTHTCTHTHTNNLYTVKYLDLYDVIENFYK